MSEVTAGRTRTRANSRLGSMWRSRSSVPLYRNGYALVAASWLTSALGLVFWILAAHLFSARAVGIGAALISAMVLVATVAQLNLKSALNRYLPAAGTGSARMVRRAYAFALVTTCVLASAFVAGTGLWAPELAFVRDQPLLAVWFVVSTLTWTVFVLQDSVLAGIRQAIWVPLENGVFALAKIAILVVIAGSAATVGVFLAWTVPLLAIVLAVNWFLFRRLLPLHERHSSALQSVSRRALARYVAADSLAYVIWAGTIGALPLIVIGIVGAEATAGFFTSWAVAYSLYLVSSGMGMSLLAEGSRDETNLSRDAGRMASAAAQIVVPGVALVFIAAPQLLAAFGQSYTEHVALLRLLSLSALPYIVVSTWVTVARVRERMRSVVIVYGALSGLVLGLGIPLLATIGTVGLGIAWLLAQSVVATVIAVRDPEVRALVLRRAREAAIYSRRLRARPALLAAIRELPRKLGVQGRRWEHLRTFETDGDVTVSAIGPGRPEAVVKRALGRAGDAAVNRERTALLARSADPRTSGFGLPIPKLLADGVLRGRAFVAQSVLPGVPGDQLIASGSSPNRAFAVGAASLVPLYRATGEDAVVGPDLIEAWVDRPLEVLGSVAGGQTVALSRLGDELRRTLMGREVRTCVTHGDLWPANMLFDSDGSSVTGVVDWERSSWQGNAGIDMMHLLITTRASAEGRELGDVVREMLESDPDDHEPLAGGPFPERTALILAWLHHVAGNAIARKRVSRVWVRRNVRPVLGLWGGWSPWFARWKKGILGFGAIAASIAVWIASIAQADPREMTDGGLLTVLPWTFALPIVLLSASFAFQVFQEKRARGVLGGHLLALIAIIHATPILVFGTLRYSWAWKHVGVIDFIQRNEAVDTGAQYLPVYHNWPGFFGLDSFATELAGLPNAIGLATWAPPVFSILSVGAVIFICRALTRDTRVVWLTAWLFVVTNWVGQEYFSPQAFAFFLYLTLIGVVVHWLDSRRPWALALAIGLIIAITVSHPLTAVLTPITLFALTATGRCAYRALPLVAAAIFAVWSLTFASGYVFDNLASTAETIALPWQTTGSSLAPTEMLSETQAMVANVSRGLVVVVCLLAAAGFARHVRSGARPWVPLALAAAPLVLFATGDYGGEILFRIYLFALPFLAFFGAQLFSRDIQPSRRPVAAGCFALATIVLAGGLLVAQYGKDHQNYYSEDEIAAASFIYENAPPGTLLVEGARTYPGQFKNYERFEYVTLSREPAESQARIVARPSAVLSEWATDPSRSAAYVIITESQKAEVEEQGTMPSRSLDRIEAALAASPQFETVLQNRDAVVFAPSPDSLR